MPALLLLLACAESPTLVTTRVWTSCFDAVGADIQFVEWQDDRGGSVGRCRLPEESTTGLRIYVEEAPGEPWRGPLQASVDGVEVQWDAPTSPRSTPDATIYEASFEGEIRAVTLDDGPFPGRTASFRTRHPLAALLGPAAVVLVFLVGISARALRKP